MTVSLDIDLLPAVDALTTALEAGEAKPVHQHVRQLINQLMSEQEAVKLLK